MLCLDLSTLTDVEPGTDDLLPTPLPVMVSSDDNHLVLNPAPVALPVSKAILDATLATGDHPCGIVEIAIRILWVESGRPKAWVRNQLMGIVTDVCSHVGAEERKGEATLQATAVDDRGSRGQQMQQSLLCLLLDGTGDSSLFKRVHQLSICMGQLCRAGLNRRLQTIAGQPQILLLYDMSQGHSSLIGQHHQARKLSLADGSIGDVVIDSQNTQNAACVAHRYESIVMNISFDTLPPFPIQILTEKMVQIATHDPGDFGVVLLLLGEQIEARFGDGDDLSFSIHTDDTAPESRLFILEENARSIISEV